MILFAMLLLAQAAPPPTASDEIVITGQRMDRLKRLRMTTKLDRKTGITRCVFKRRSGDPKLDDAVCNAVLACVPKVNTVKEMQACIATTMNALVANGARWQADAARGRN
ncbi:hypothetical protein [Sphingomonas xinjiangensis]|uniref:Uncharacterized protein n=1 Tax=Sphingomonas xinjiangensis TaxID=643568 RepID=A0A840YT06_9SPHN|nr:hypothetical protein [Sphingomonas xinjiangensis]MBB5712805.1 hypothetical protein [Sphingomonas xinjiangensis]